GFFGRLCTCIHRDADIRLRERRRVVGTVTSHGHEFAFGLLLLDQPHLILRSRFGEKIVYSSIPGDGRSGARLVSGNHDSANTHGSETVKSLFDTAFDNVFEMNNAKDFVSLGNYQRSSAGITDAMDNPFNMSGNCTAKRLNVGSNSIRCPFANYPPVQIASAHAGLCAERD